MVDDKEKASHGDPMPDGAKAAEKHAHNEVKEKPKAEEMVQISEKELTHLKHELDKAKKEAAHNLDGWQRERAEFSNYRKRIERDQAQDRQVITGSIIKKYLVILDDLERALKNRPTGGDGAGWAEGIELIRRKLIAILDAEGIERINQNKVQFDPQLHEAISSEENPDFESGEIIEVVQQGYKLGDRILRPAMVRVAR